MELSGATFEVVVDVTEALDPLVFDEIRLFAEVALLLVELSCEVVLVLFAGPTAVGMLVVVVGRLGL